MPASPNDYLKYITIDDFKPGISDNPGANYPSGSAQRDQTFRCIANRQGALTPLPARTIPFSMPSDGTPAPDSRFAIDGLYAPPISMLPTVLAFNPDIFPEHELMVGNEWLQGGNLNQKLRRVRRYEAAGTTMDTIMSVSQANAATTLIPSGMGFGTTRSNRTTPTMPGVPVVAAMWVNGFLFNYVIEFPDDAAPTTNTPYTVFSNTAFFLGLCCHQGRTVAQQATSYDQGVNTKTFMGENIIWSDFNDITNTLWSTAAPQVFVPENPSGFAFLCSMSANEMFAVKLYGGIYVTGDLNTGPFVTSLPMVTGSEVQQAPVVTGQGVVYGNQSTGIWMWSHGDTSQLLSPQMIPDFWLLDVPPEHELDVYGGVRYQFARCDDWVLVPNNWLYDTTIQSWWRFEDPNVTAVRYWTVMSRFIYGASGFYDNSTLSPISMWERSYTPPDNALNYSWQSQPLWETVGNLTDVRAITIRAKGQGTVTVTVTGETSTATVQFEINSTLPILRRQTLRLQDANIAVKIVADSVTEAPTVYECNVGTDVVQRETQTQ